MFGFRADLNCSKFFDRTEIDDGAITERATHAKSGIKMYDDAKYES